MCTDISSDIMGCLVRNILLFNLSTCNTYAVFARCAHISGKLPWLANLSICSFVITYSECFLFCRSTNTRAANTMELNYHFNITHWFFQVSLGSSMLRQVILSAKKSEANDWWPFWFFILLSLFNWSKAWATQTKSKACWAVLSAQPRPRAWGAVGACISCQCLLFCASCKAAVAAHNLTAPGSPTEENHAGRGLMRIRISLLVRKTTHADEKRFHLIKYPLTDRLEGSILICWWWIPRPTPPVGMARSTISENCFDESEVCQFDFNRKNGRKYLSYDCAGLLRMHECSFYSSHLIQVSRTENGVRNMGMIY